MNSASQLSHAYVDIYEQFARESSFLWLLRSLAVNQPHYNLQDIKALEGRIQAHLDGLLTSTDVAWPLCESALELNGPGDVFTAAIVAFTTDDSEKIEQVIRTGLASDETFKGLISALAWLPSATTAPWTHRWLLSKDLDRNYLAISLYGLRRENPGEYLRQFLHREDCRKHEKLYVRCLRIVGESKRRDLLPELNKAMASDNATISFWANWSAILLGNKARGHTMEPYVFEPSPHQQRALNIAFRVLPVNDGCQWITRLSNDLKNVRSAIKAMGILGDPQVAERLIEKMRDVEHARLAGEAFTLITGVDLEKNELTRDPPNKYESSPNEDASDNEVEVDEDEKSPWPNADLVEAHWQTVSAGFKKGRRYLLGQDINSGNLSRHLREGYQRQRHAAAMELALLDASQVLQNTRAKVLQA